MKSILLCLSAIMLAVNVKSQSCFEITRILVDACGGVEGENEMVTFVTGPNTLNTAFMTVQWPNNSWLGLCQDAGTAAKVAAFNNNIQGCGYLLEPVNGILPANSKVLLITSTAVNTLANSFANLNDTVYVLFQCAGNTAGHFANFNVVPGLRTTIITFSNLSGCTDTVTYDRTKLINQYGYFGGASYENDGAFVEFAANGTPTYLNYGCQAPVSNFSVNAGKDTVYCSGFPVLLQGTVAGAASLQWNGGTGTISNPAAAVTSYWPAPGEYGSVLFTLSANGSCALAKTDSVIIYLAAPIPVPVIQNNNPLLISSVSNPAYFYQWYLNGIALSGATSPQLNITQAGCYGITVTDSVGCKVESDTICLTPVGIEHEEFNHLDAYIAYSTGADPQLILSVPTDAGIAVYDIAGRRVYEHQIRKENFITLNRELPQGTYLLNLKIKTLILRMKFTIMNNSR